MLQAPTNILIIKFIRKLRRCKQSYFYLITYFSLLFIASNAIASTCITTHSYIKQNQSLTSDAHHKSLHLNPHWQLNLSYMWMNMAGLRNGTHSVSNALVFAQGFMNSPERMHTNLFMFGLMYMPNKRYHIMVMLPYWDKTMQNRKRNGVTFSDESRGFGDIFAKVNYLLLHHHQQRWHISIGLSAPTGSITQSGLMGTKMRMRLPYPMQLGSGTFDVLLGTRYVLAFQHWHWGTQLAGVIRLGRNRFDYAFGNEFYLATWLQHPLGHYLIATLRLSGHSLGRIRGQDPNIHPMMSPTADPALQGGQCVNLTGTMTLHHFKHIFKGQTLQLELGHPIYQRLNGPQLQATWFGMLLWHMRV